MSPKIQLSVLNLRSSTLCFILCLFLYVCLFSGCSPLYLFQVAFEEGRILWRRQPIEQLLKNGDVTPERREKLTLVLAVREFARERLHFRVGGSYASYSHVDRPVLSYVLMATPKIELKPHTWWYPIVGPVPYKGFPSEEAAKREADSFAAKGYDTYIRTSQAYSTLGWFDDPLLGHLLNYNKVTLAEVIFHELLHNTLFVKGSVDFNESLANFVGSRAAILFFHEQNGVNSSEHLQAVQAWEEELEFAKFLAGLAETLNDLYARDISLDEKLRLREEVFFRSQKEWAAQVANRPKHRYGRFAQQTLNNAAIAHYLLYLSQLDLFESLFVIAGRDLRAFVELVGKHVKGAQDPFAVVRGLVNERRLGAAMPQS